MKSICIMSQTSMHCVIYSIFMTENEIARGSKETFAEPPETLSRTQKPLRFPERVYGPGPGVQDVLCFCLRGIFVICVKKNRQINVCWLYGDVTNISTINSKIKKCHDFITITRYEYKEFIFIDSRYKEHTVHRGRATECHHAGSGTAVEGTWDQVFRCSAGQRSGLSWR